MIDNNTVNVIFTNKNKDHYSSTIFFKPLLIDLISKNDKK